MELNRIQLLNGLLQINNDRYKAYQIAIDNADEDDRKNFFHRCSKQSQYYINELRHMVQDEGGSVTDEAIQSGHLYRYWMDLYKRSSRMGGDRVLYSCIHAEDVCISKYEEALLNLMPIEIAKLLIRQKNELLSSAEEMKAITVLSAAVV